MSAGPSVQSLETLSFHPRVAFPWPPVPDRFGFCTGQRCRLDLSMFPSNPSCPVHEEKYLKSLDRYIHKDDIGGNLDMSSTLNESTLENWFCEPCGEMGLGYDDFQDHTNHQHGGFPCPEFACGREEKDLFQDVKVFYSHWYWRHRDRGRGPSPSKSTSTSPGPPPPKKARNRSTETVVCKKCPYTTRHEAGMKRHKTVQEPPSAERPHKCEAPKGCDSWFRSTYERGQHHRIHPEMRSWHETGLCNVAFCPQKITRYKSLNTHKNNVHKVSTDFKCEEMEEYQTYFSTEDTRSKHQKLHHTTPESSGKDIRLSAEGKFGCDDSMCPQRFKTEDSLEVHKRTVHRGNGSLVCHKGCSGKFTSKRSRTNHHMIHDKSTNRSGPATGRGSPAGSGDNAGPSASGANPGDKSTTRTGQGSGAGKPAASSGSSSSRQANTSGQNQMTTSTKVSRSSTNTSGPRATTQSSTPKTATTPLQIRNSNTRQNTEPNATSKSAGVVAAAAAAPVKHVPTKQALVQPRPSANKARAVTTSGPAKTTNVSNTSSIVVPGAKRSTTRIAPGSDNKAVSTRRPAAGTSVGGDRHTPVQSGASPAPPGVARLPVKPQHVGASTGHKQTQVSVRR